MTETDFDPFAGVADEPDPGPIGTLAGLLDATRRGYVPLRKTFVQKPKGSTTRASTLAKLVTGRHQRPLDALLLLHALQPILPGSPLPLGSWARILSTRTRCTSQAAANAFETLIGLDLVTRKKDGREPVLEPLLEDGSKDPWTRPGFVEEEGPGYFTMTHEYWTEGIADQLNLPGKAMLLILLAETQNPKTPAFAMAVERAPAYYGISERTAERGYGELGKAGLVVIRRAKVADPRHPAGRRDVYWRALTEPFRTTDRARLQRLAAKAVTGRPATGTATGTAAAGSRPEGGENTT